MALNLHGGNDVLVVAADNSKYNLIIRLKGSHMSPYKGGMFYINVKIPKGYPFKRPIVRFLTKIFHPNVSRHGDISCDFFDPKFWTSGTTLLSAMIAINILLTNPDIEACAESFICKEFMRDKLAFNEIAREWTRKYAFDLVHE